MPTGGGVATWLPDGRWLAPGELDGPAAGDRLDRSRRRRRLAAIRIVAWLAGWPRRALAAGLLLTAALVAVRPDPAPATSAAPPAGIPVVVVSRDLPAGATLATSDLRTAALPAGAVPAGAFRAMPPVLGRTIAGPVRRGEPITDARLLGPGLTAGLGPQESAAVPVRLADAQAAAILRAGDRVDVLGTAVEATPTAASGPGEATVVANQVRVLAVLRDHDAADGVLLVVAAAPKTARRLAGAAARYRLAVAVRPP